MFQLSLGCLQLGKRDHNIDMMPRVLCVVSFLAGAVMAQVDREPGRGLNFYSLEKEIGLGNQMAVNFQRDTRAIESPAALAYVDAIGQRLAAQTGGPAFTYKFALIGDDPNPMHEVVAFPGGSLFVPASLILAVESEDELAGMLAHAIAHVASRDGTRQASRVHLANTTSVPLVYMGAMGGYATMPLAVQQTWRKYEVDADRLAAHKMAAAGYDPAALVRYIEREQAPDEAESKISALPQRSERVAAIREVISGLPPQMYGPHEGLAKVQEEVRRLTTNKPKAPPSLFK